MSAPKVIAVGYDGSECAEAALRWSAAMAVAVGADLRLVHAVGLLEHAGLISVDSIETARQLATRAGLPPDRFHVVVIEGDPTEVMCSESTAGADMLVVGTRGAGSHPGVLLGSTSMALVERARIPVVVVPSPNS